MSRSLKQTIKARTKEKTRGEASSNTDSDNTERIHQPQTQPPAAAQLRFELPRKPFAVLDEIFPEGDHGAVSSVSWQDFQNMMGDIGFSIETNSGSAFAFMLEGHGRIVIHRPHPDSTLESYHLRNIATGLENQFGWQRLNFTQL